MFILNVVSSFLLLTVASATPGNLPLASYSSFGSILSPAPLLSRAVLPAPFYARALSPYFSPRPIAYPYSAQLVAPAPQIGYIKSVPQNVYPYASQVNIERRALSGYAVRSFVPQIVSAPALLRAALPSLYLTQAPIVSSYPIVQRTIPAAVSVPIENPPLETRAIFHSEPKPVLNNIVPSVPAVFSPATIISSRTRVIDPIPVADTPVVPESPPVVSDSETQNVPERNTSEEIPTAIPIEQN